MKLRIPKFLYNRIRVAPGRSLGVKEFIRWTYLILLGREADAGGLAYWQGRLDRGELTPDQFVGKFIQSLEFTQNRLAKQFDEAIHHSRMQIVKGLPKARTIVDLGGSSLNNRDGAMVVMGYPYAFENLYVVELPPEERHAIYKNLGDYDEVHQSRLGPVTYVYRSMADLAPFADGSVDLVYSGESIEHVSREDAARTCREVFRILKPGGYFCLDTPNRNVTRHHFNGDFIHPEHKHEYTHAEAVALLERHGFQIRDAKGAWLATPHEDGSLFMPEQQRHGAFWTRLGSPEEGLFDDIENCYLLYYKCQKPG